MREARTLGHGLSKQTSRVAQDWWVSDHKLRNVGIAQLADVALEAQQGKQFGTMVS